MTKRLILPALLVLSFISIKAQGSDVPPANNYTTSPYSRYGYGVLSDKGIGASRSMGGLSYGLRNQNVNPGNPASYSSVDSLTFIFDIGVSYSNTKLSQPGASQNDDGGGLDFLAIQFPLSKKLGFSAGFLPYSSVGYSYGSSETIGTETYSKVYSGTGGLDQIYAGLAYQPFKWISVGANAAYLYGTIRHNRGMPFYSDNTIASVYEYKTVRVNALKLDFGIQTSFNISRSKTLTLGAVYTPKINADSRFKQLTVDATNGDTISLLGGEDGLVRLPHTFGFGFAISSKNLTYGADVTFQKWKGLEYNSLMQDSLSQDNRFNDRWRFNAGVEYSINPNSRNFFQRMKFRAGVNYSNSYLNVQEAASKVVDGYKVYGASVGFGFPFRDSFTGRVSYVNLGFEYSRLNPNYKNMIKEEYFGITLNVNLNDMWFMKNKFK